MRTNLALCQLAGETPAVPGVASNAEAEHNSAEFFQTWNGEAVT